MLTIVLVCFTAACAQSSVTPPGEGMAFFEEYKEKPHYRAIATTGARSADPKPSLDVARLRIYVAALDNVLINLAVDTERSAIGIRTSRTPFWFRPKMTIRRSDGRPDQ